MVISMKDKQLAAKILIRTSEANRDWLKAKAVDQDRSVNWIINKIFTDAKEAEEKKAQT